MSKKVYSIDSENFSSYDDVISELELAHKSGKYLIECGEPIYANHLDFINGEGLIESIQESCWDEHGEYAEEYLQYLTSNDQKELEKMVADWLNKKAGKPNFYSVINIKKVEVELKK